MVIPGILEETFEKVEEKIRLVEEVSPVVQVDVVDDTLVPGKTFLEVGKLGSLNTPADITIHFMVENPVKFIKRTKFFIPIIKRKIRGVSTVITQLIPNETLEDFIKVTKDLGYKVGLSINTNQDNSLLDPFVKDIDLIQFMGVIPGKQGSEFIPKVLDKIKDFKNRYPTMKTQIDGGINEITLPLVLETSVDNIVVGSAIFNSEDPKKKYLEFSSYFDEKRNTAHGSGIYNK